MPPLVAKTMAAATGATVTALTSKPSLGLGLKFRLTDLPFSDTIRRDKNSSSDSTYRCTAVWTFVVVRGVGDEGW